MWSSVRCAKQSCSALSLSTKQTTRHRCRHHCDPRNKCKPLQHVSLSIHQFPYSHLFIYFTSQPVFFFFFFCKQTISRGPTHILLLFQLTVGIFQLSSSLSSTQQETICTKNTHPFFFFYFPRKTRKIQ